MYVDNLILVTQASRKSSHNIRLCLCIYQCLTSQRANSIKSEIYFPTRFNKRLQKSITVILQFKNGAFPLNYLGILVAPKRLALSQFNTMLDKIRKTITLWNHSKLSTAGKTILINSSILSTLLYYLSVYPVPNTILDAIANYARLFFWSKSSNRKGMNSVSWTDTMLDKTEGGGLSFRNLHYSKILLMAKNVFN